MTDRPNSAPEKIRIEGDRKAAIETGRNRLIVAGAVVMTAFLLIAFRVVDVALLSGSDEPRVTESVGKEDRSVGRADIVDRDGRLLATSLRTASLYADPHKVLDPEQAAHKLVTVLPDLDVKEVERRLRSDRGFVWIRRHLTPRQEYAVNKLGIPALNFEPEERRIYPLGPLAAHVLGFTDVDNRGISGVERYFDKDLRIRKTSLQLSIDIRIQHILQRELRASMEKFDAIGAAGIVMNVNTGEVVALTSLPTFDPNQPSEISKDALFNRATLGVYEMGSTFKIFNTAMALEAGTATMHSDYDATHPIRVARFVIHDDHAQRRWLSVPEIFMYSSNIGSVKMALEVGSTAQQTFLRSLGLMRPVPIQFPELGMPLIPTPWRDINTMTVAFGQGMAVSPLHMVTAVSAIVNGGIYRDPTLLKRDPNDIPKGRRVVSLATSLKMRKLMRLVVEKGTGRKAEAVGYVVGGKTGTAEKPSAHGYLRKSLISSFIGAFPMENPKYVVLALVDEPKGTKDTYGYATGGWVAAPVVSAVVRRMAPLVGIDPVDENSEKIRDELYVDVSGDGGEQRVAAH